MADKSTWVTLVQAVNLASGRTGRSKLSAVNLYTKVNTVRLACGLPTLYTAPSSLPPAPPLPEGLIVHASQTGAFACALMSPTVYSRYVQVQAAPTAPAGYNTYNLKSFRVIGMLNGLVYGANPITQMYIAKYGPASVGSEIALSLVPMSLNGERLPGCIITGLVSSTAAEDTLSEGSDEPALLRAA